jgi:hypothetical protein
LQTANLYGSEAIEQPHQTVAGRKRCPTPMDNDDWGLRELCSKSQRARPMD